MPITRSAETIKVEGLAAFRRELRKVQTEGGENGQALLGEANERVADFVITHALVKARSEGDQAIRAALTMDASKSGVSARINAGGNKAPFFGGAEFGAHRNLRRLIKKPVRRTSNGGKTFTTKRSRATVVRDSEDIGKVARRVERQYVDKAGRTVTKKEGGRKVELERTQSGALKVIRGWNQFKPWRGNKAGAGYFLFPTIRNKFDEIGEIYMDELDRINRQIFPD